MQLSELQYFKPDPKYIGLNIFFLEIDRAFFLNFLTMALLPKTKRLKRIGETENYSSTYTYNVNFPPINHTFDP